MTMEGNNYTLEQMSADYQALKDKLENQEIVSDRLLRETMRSKRSSIRSKAAISVVCGLFVIISAPLVFHFNPMVNASWWFTGATEVLMAFCIYLDWKFNSKVQGTDLSSCDLLTFSKDVRKLRSDYRDWIKWGMILGSAWIIWLDLEVWFKSGNPKLALCFIMAITLGFVVGMIIGLRMNREIVRTCNEIIDNIEK